MFCGYAITSENAGWYDPVRLLSMASGWPNHRHGKMVYRRELIAALDPFERPESTNYKEYLRFKI